MQTILTADNRVTEASGVGLVTLKVNLGRSKQSTITLLDVLYMPTFAVNLVSQGAMHNKLTLQPQGNMTLAINRRNEVVCWAIRVGNLSYLNVEGADVANLTVASTDALIWHKRLGHPSAQRMKELQRNIPEVRALPREVRCNTCEVSKLQQLPFKRSTSQTKEPLELIHTDVVGKMPDETYLVHRFAVTFIDNYTHFVAVYLMQKKSEVLKHFMSFKTRMEKQTGKSIKRIWSDNGGEYIGHDFEAFMQTNGIIHECTAPYTPQQNGVAEQMNGTLFSKVQCMMHKSRAPRFMWGKALLHAAYITN